MPTMPEKAVWASLERLGFQIKPYRLRSDFDNLNTFYSEVVIEELPGIRLDLALVHAKIAIEVDGEYWHARGPCTSQQLVTRFRDEKKGNDLKKADWKLIRIRESHLDRVDMFLNTCILRLLEV